MRIIQISASYKPAYIYGGPIMSVSKLSEELIKDGVDIQVFTTTANGDEELQVKCGEKQRVEGVPVIYFSRLTKDHSHFSLTLLKHLFKQFNNKHEEVIHIHAWWNLVSVLACLIALWKGKTILLSPRGTLSAYSFKNRNSLLKKVFHIFVGKQLLKYSHLHVTSQKEKNDILNISKPLSVTVIPNFVQLVNAQHQFITPTLTKEDDRLEAINLNPFKLLFLSRIEEKKGLDILFKALKIVNIPFHLTIAGTGAQEYLLWLKTLGSELGISHKISWIGQQNIEDKFSIMNAHDLLILPSHDENFANVIVESLSVGTPVLISKYVGLADYIKINDYGWISDTKPEEIRKMTEMAYIDISKRERIREQAPRKIKADFNEKDLVKKYIDLYKNIIK